MSSRLLLYARLVRLDKPIGILLLLWPTLWGLWFAAQGMPHWSLLFVFIAGTVLMRSAGCAINDYADRDFDKHVRRTQHRVLTSGLIQPRQALWVAVGLAAAAGTLLFALNVLSFFWACGALVIAATYPYFKRFFAIPQAYLGLAFGFGIPMAFAAILNQVTAIAFYLMLANLFWTIAYDTEYAMVDRVDDLRLGLRTSAITFGAADVAAVAICYGASLAILVWVGVLQKMGWAYFAGLGIAACIASVHIHWIKRRDPAQCFRAFLHNNWIGAAIFTGIALDFALRS